MIAIERMNIELFDWLTWRNGSILNIFKIPHRTLSILENKHIIKKYAIGYCKADNLLCRPKKNHMAVMFNTGELYNWWTHFRMVEFETIFDIFPNKTKEAL